MDAHRKKRLRSLLATKFKGDRGKLIEKSGLSKGRIAQLLDEKDQQPFGERAARSLAAKLGLPDRYFEGEAAAAEARPAKPAKAASEPSAEPYYVDPSQIAVDGQDISPKEEIILRLVRSLTPGQQDELLPALRAAFDANNVTRKILGKNLKTISNRRMEEEFGLPGKVMSKDAKGSR